MRADGDRQAFRILFAAEGKTKAVLLALEGISKKSQNTPPEAIRVAERRLADWRRRGARRGDVPSRWWYLRNEIVDGRDWSL